MEALLINGSPRIGGNTARALKEIEDVFSQVGIHVTTVQVGTHDITGCTACGRCGKLGHCVKDDIGNEVAPLFEKAACVNLRRRLGPTSSARPSGKFSSYKGNMPSAIRRPGTALP